jgi:hypothetical protein
MQRDVHEDVTERILRSANPASASSEDPRHATVEPYTPLSLKSGAGRQYWDEVLRLLVTIRADCDAAAERLGYASHKDDGLAAVEYIALKVLDAIRGERRQHSANKPSAKQQTPPRSPEGPQQSFTQPQYKSDQRAQPGQPGGPSERPKLISELKQMLRDGITRAGAVIDPPLAHEIAKHITILNEEIARPQTAESIERIRERLARFFGKSAGGRKVQAKAAAAAVAQKGKPARPAPARPKTPNKAVTRRSATKRAKATKRRSR